MSYQVTRPDADQVKFTSSKTGDWTLEDYIQSAEYGNMTLAQLLGLIFNVDGSFKDALSAAIGTVTTGSAGSSAAVTNTGTSKNLTLNFTIPRGDQGIQGLTGRSVVSIIRTSGTGAAGTTDTYTVTYSDTTTTTFNVVNGANGIGAAGTANPVEVGVAAPGTDPTNFSRQDHVHPATVDGGRAIGYKEVPQNIQSAAYTLALTDSGKHILHPSADTTARTFTIPADASVAFPVGTAITIVNANAAGVITIAITTDTLYQAGTGATGSRTLAANGICTLLKLTSTTWMISGSGLS